MNDTLIHSFFQTDIGPARALFVGDSLAELSIAGPLGFRDAAPEEGRHPLLETLVEELSAYLAGRLASFTIPLRPSGTDNQKKVWRALAEIPYGQTRTYKQISQNCGIASARAVGTMVGQNPIAVLLPCHRVVRSDGKIGQYSAGRGAETKRLLLRLEGAAL